MRTRGGIVRISGSENRCVGAVPEGVFPAPGSCADGSGQWLPYTDPYTGRVRPVCPSEPDVYRLAAISLITCKTCRYYAWLLGSSSNMQPVSIGGEFHHPSCPVVRWVRDQGYVPRTLIGAEMPSGFDAQYVTLDRRGARWLLRHRVATVFTPAWVAISDQYPSAPLSGAAVDVPYIEESNEADLWKSIDRFASMHTPYTDPTTPDLASPYVGVDLKLNPYGAAKALSSKTIPASPPSPSPPGAPTPAALPAPSAYPTPMFILRESNNLVKEVAPGFNRSQRHIVLAIGRFESGFGRTLFELDGSIHPAAQFVPAGVPSFNWGGLVATGNQPYFLGSDRTRDGKVYNTHFRRFATAREGLVAFLQRWGDSATLTAAADGDAFGVAARMYETHYYTGTAGSDLDRIRTYAKAIASTAETIASALSEPVSVRVPPVEDLSGGDSGSGGGGGGGGAVAVVGLLGAVLLFRGLGRGS